MLLCLWLPTVHTALHPRHVVCYVVGVACGTRMVGPAMPKEMSGQEYQPLHAEVMLPAERVLTGQEEQSAAHAILRSRNAAITGHHTQ
jgi:hypothetical protein